MILSGGATDLYAFLYWDTNGNNPGAAQATNQAFGTWGSSTAWSISPLGTAETGGWVPGEFAVFSAGGDATGSFIVPLFGDQVVDGISFEEGNIAIGGGAALTLTGGTLNVASGLSASIGAPIGGSAGLNKTGAGTLLLTGQLSHTGNTTVSGGTLKLSDGIINNSGIVGALNGGVLELGVTSSAGGIIGGHVATATGGVINITNTYSLHDVTLALNANIETVNGITIAIANTVTNHTAIEIRNSVNYSGVAISGDATLAGSGVVTLVAGKVIGGGVLTNGVGHTIQGSGVFSWGSNVRLHNNGLVDANENGSTLELHNAGVNTGTLRASNGGTLLLAAGVFTNTGGSVRALDGSTVLVGSGVGGTPATIVGGTLATSGSGVIRTASESRLENVTLDVASTLQLGIHSLVRLTGTLTNNGSFGLGFAPGNTTVAINGAVTVTGTGVWQMTPISNNSVTTSNGAGLDVLTNDAMHTIRGTGTIGQFGGLTFLNKGLVDANHSAGLNIRGDNAVVSNMGTMRASSGGTLHFFRSAFTNTGVLEALDGSTVDMDIFNAALMNATAGTLNGGTYRVIDSGGGATMRLTADPVTAIAAGTTIELSGAGATLRFIHTHLAASLTNNAGTLKIFNGHSFNLAHSLNNTGTLAGNGTVVGNVQNNGIVAPGTSPGTLTVTGNYTQSSGGSLQIELASLASLDKLTVSGSVALAGTLNVVLASGFAPALGNSFDILDWGSLSGAFSSLQLPSLPGPLTWSVAQLYTAGIISVVASSSLPGDYNHNGVVDANDYVVWRDTRGSTTNLAADGNGNNLIDTGDYTFWRARFGNTAGSGAGENAVVPEPSSTSFLLWACVCALLVAGPNRLRRMRYTAHRARVHHALCASLTLQASLFGWLGGTDIRAAYTFTNIADTNSAAPMGTFTHFDTFPAISGSTVAFLGKYGSRNGIFRGNGGALTTIAKASDPAPMATFSEFNNPGLSGSTAAFQSSYGGGSGVFTGNGGLVATIAKTGDAAPSGTFSSFVPDLVAYSGSTAAFRAGFTGGNGIFTGSGGALATIAKTGDAAPSGTFSSFSTPALSGGVVAFRGRYDSSKSGVFTGSGGLLTTIAKTGDPAPSGMFSNFESPAISGNTVAFIGDYIGRSGIFRGSGGALTTIVETGDPAPSGTFLSINNPAISGNLVAFYGTYSGSGGSGIFTGTGGPLTTVIKTGDPLFGSTLSGLFLSSFGATGLDAGGSGNLAFAYSLADGRSGVAMAMPGVTMLVGDYNRNGVVDAPDYAVWRDTLGSTTNLAADGNGSSIIDSGDYSVWRTNFGQTSGSGLAAAPEPACWAFLSVAALALLTRKRW
jgi:autotransporter-associated beta strand protein